MSDKHNWYNSGHNSMVYVHSHHSQYMSIDPSVIVPRGTRGVYVHV